VQSVQEAICDMHDDLVSVCLKGVLGTKSQQSRIRDIVAVVEQMVIRRKINVNLSYLWPEMMFGGFSSCIHRDLLMDMLGCWDTVMTQNFRPQLSRKSSK